MDGTVAATAVQDVSDLTPYVRQEGDGERSLNLLVDGMHCAGCQNRIEKRLRQVPGVVVGRVNLTARRLASAALEWVLSKPEAPFFLLVHTYEPHHPYAHDEFADPADAKLPSHVREGLALERCADWWEAECERLDRLAAGKRGD